MKVGVFASALIKKRRFVYGDAIDAYMADKGVGEADALHGWLDNMSYTLLEPDYVMKIMSSYGGLTVKVNEETSTRAVANGAVNLSTPSHLRTTLLSDTPLTTTTIFARGKYLWRILG